MKINAINVFHVNAGWRPWTFVKISSNEGIIGWSECSDSHGSPKGIEGVIHDLSDLLIGENPLDINKILLLLHSRTKQSPGSIIQKAIAGIENALWDIKAKSLNLPVHDLLGGPVRKEIELYWSHCGTSRVRAAKLIDKPQISNLRDLEPFSQEILNSGFKSIKTNMAILKDKPIIYMPGFAKSEGWPDLNCSDQLLEDVALWISNLRSLLGKEVRIALDLNFNFKNDGFIRVSNAVEKYNLEWVEIDSYNPTALKEIKDSINIPITSCENLYGLRQYDPFLKSRSMNIASIDVIWNGLKESIKIANAAAINNIDVACHNFNGHLSTFISMHFCSLIENFKIGEFDVDDVPWRDEFFTDIPIIRNGKFYFNSKPGWGCDLNEKSIKKYEWIG